MLWISPRKSPEPFLKLQNNFILEFAGLHPSLNGINQNASGKAFPTCNSIKKDNLTNKPGRSKILFYGFIRNAKFAKLPFFKIIYRV